MSQMIDFTVPSTVPGRTLHAFRCVPEGEVRAILQLSHGMVEFIDRYKPAPSAQKTTTVILPSQTATVRFWPISTP